MSAKPQDATLTSACYNSTAAVPVIRFYAPKGEPETSASALFVRLEDYETVGRFNSAILPCHDDNDLKLLPNADRSLIILIHPVEALHQGWQALACSQDAANLKVWHPMLSRVFAERKYGLSASSERALLSSATKLASPHAWRRKCVKKAAFLGYVIGDRCSAATKMES